MSQWWACSRYFSGTTSISFISTSSGVLPTASPVRLPTRKMWVSTAMVGSPKATLSTTFAVLRPTPGIGGLRGQHHGEQQGERIDGLQLAARLRVGGGKAAERLFDFGLRPLRQFAVRGLAIGLGAQRCALELGGLERRDCALAGRFAA